MPSLNERKNKLKEKKDAEPGDLFISFFFNLKHFQPTLPKIFSTWYVLRSWTYTYAAAPIFYTLVILTNQILFILYKYEKRKKESKKAKGLHFFFRANFTSRIFFPAVCKRFKMLENLLPVRQIFTHMDCLRN